MTWRDHEHPEAPESDGDSSGIHLIPSPRDGRDAGRSVQGKWEFDAVVHEAQGADADWLAAELATVTRDLLLWARQERG